MARAGSTQCTYHGPYREAVVRSLITLKALTYAPTGGIVAAAHDLAARGDRRGPQLGLPLLLAARRRHHPLRAAAHRLPRGGPRLARRGCCARSRATRQDLQIMYGIAGERRLGEPELDWLPGYEGSAPVRVGNGAATSSSWTSTARSSRPCTWRT